MTGFYIDFWPIILGAMSGMLSVAFAKGRNRFVIAIVIGAGVGVLFPILKGML
jgi:hypothetical protein